MTAEQVGQRGVLHGTGQKHPANDGGPIQPWAAGGDPAMSTTRRLKWGTAPGGQEILPLMARADVGVRAVAEVAASLRSHLEGDISELDDAERPDAMLHRVADKA